MQLKLFLREDTAFICYQLESIYLNWTEVLSQWGRSPQKFRYTFLDCLPEKAPRSQFSALLSIKCQIIEILGKWNAKKGKIFKILCLKMPILAHKKSKRPHKTT